LKRGQKQEYIESEARPFANGYTSSG